MKKKILLVFAGVLMLAFFSCKSSDKNTNPTPKPSASANETENSAAAEAPVESTEDETQALLDKASAAREAAIAAGADVLLPDQFADADTTYNDLVSRNESGENVNGELSDITTRFNAYEVYAKAVNAKDKIDKYGLAAYDQNAYDEGSRLLEQARPEIEDINANAETAYADANAAYVSLEKVLTTGYKAKAKEERMHAFEAKQNADSVYAAVARKEKYGAGVQHFRDGDASYAMQNPEAAFNHYQEARTTFEELFSEISNKRQEAEKAIDEAKARVAESEAYAKQADNQAPLVGNDIKGIEDENAVLLKEETYENPEEAAEAIPETIGGAAIDRSSETPQNKNVNENETEESTLANEPDEHKQPIEDKAVQGEEKIKDDIETIQSKEDVK